MVAEALRLGPLTHFLPVLHINLELVIYVLTTNTAGPRKLDITCCDVEDAIIARNALFLSFLLEDPNAITPNTLWNIYYHLYLDNASLDSLQQQITRLLAVSSSLDQWKQSKYGSTLRFYDSAGFVAVRGVWSHFREAAAAKDTSDYQQRFKTDFKKSIHLRDATWGKDSINYRAVRAAASLASDATMGKELEGVIEECESLAARHFHSSPKPSEILTPSTSDITDQRHLDWTKGTVGNVSDGTSIPNPMFACAPPGSPIIMTGSEPIISYHLAAAYANLAETSPLRLVHEAANDVPKVVRVAQLQFQEWVDAFRDLKMNFTVRFAAADCFALCHTLLLNFETRQTTAHWYRRLLSFAPLELDASEYGKDGQAPNRFDVIDTSNLADHFGALNVLVSARPLLKDAAWATLSTEVMEKGVEPEQRKFDLLLCGHTRTLSVLLGLAPVEYWTNATTASTVDEYLLVKSADSVAGRSKNPSIQARISWKAAHHVAGARSSGRSTVDASKLANLAFKIYQDMFKFECASFLSDLAAAKDKALSAAATYPRHHRGTFVAFLKALARNVNTDDESMYKRIMEMIQNDKDNIFASNTLQALAIEMARQGLYKEEVRISQPSALRDSRDLYMDLP